MMIFTPIRGCNSGKNKVIRFTLNQNIHLTDMKVYTELYQILVMHFEDMK